MSTSPTIHPSPAAKRTGSNALRLSFAAALLLTIGTSQAQTAASTPDKADLPIATCAACHGPQGEGSLTGVPRLAGNDADYLAHALSMFKVRTRASAVMQTVAQNLSEAQMRDLGVYFSQQHPPLLEAPQAPSPELVKTGRQLAEAGDGSNAACFSCHGTGGKGQGARFPGIASQPLAFTVMRLHEFQGRAKAGPIKPGSMTEAAAKLSESQIQASAAFLSTLTP